jgi:hypothetical protein
MIRIGKGPTAPDRHQTTIALFREDHAEHRGRLWSATVGGVSLRTSLD